MPSWAPRTKLEWFYFGATATQAVVITVIQSIILVVYLKWVNTSVYEVPISYVTSLSLAVTTLGVLYQLVLTLDAYRIKNNIQLFIQCICNICLSVATIMQRRQIKVARDRIIVGENLAKMPFAKNDWKFWERVSPGLIVCIVVSCLCSLAMCALAFALYREFSWALYQQVSPDAKTRQRYTYYQIYLILLKFAPFFLIAFVVVFGLINVHYVQPEFSLTMALIPIALILVGLAVYFVRNENRVGFVMVLVGHTGEIAYLISRLITLFDPKSRHSSTLLKDEMLFLLIVALAFYTFALIVGCICLANFGKGLKPIVLGQVQRKSGLNASDEAYYFQRLNHHVPPTPSSQNGRFQLD